MYLFKFTLFLALFHTSLAVKGQQFQQQCECAGGASPVIGTGAVAFAPYDDNCKVDYSKIPEYGAYLQNDGINSVAINTPQGGGSLLTVSEQKQITKCWCDLKKSTGFPYTLICQTPTSDNYNDTLYMARFYKKMCCDIVVSVAPLDYPPPDVDGLVTYLTGIAKACDPTPFIYSTLLFPLCELTYNTAKVYSCMSKACDNFRGVLTTFEDALIVQAVNDFYPDKILVSLTSSDIVGVGAFCMNGSVTTVANVLPKTVVQIMQTFFSGNIDKADSIQKDLNQFLFTAYNAASEPDVVDRRDLAREIQIIRALMYITQGFDVGQVSTPPYPKLSRDTMLRLYQICEDAGVATTYPYDVDSYTEGNNQYIKKTKRNTEEPKKCTYYKGKRVCV